ncbi:MAG TPA: efflux RND transporter periplasmic adaptor subunit [Thermoanaerobaculia bacterium]|nr:efflux RND transporter periplasmic adaptor subunit [Thermoanaerobaculia bacterium]
MKIRRSSIRFVTASLLALSLLLAGCGDDSAAANARPGRPPAVVELAPVQQGSFDAAVRFVGRLEAESSAELTARTDGPITAVYAGSGDRVRRGQLLAQIDPAEAQQQVNQAQAALRMSEATVNQRRASLELSRSNASRSQSLFSERLLSQSDLDMVQGELSTAASQLELARAQVEQARASLNSARLRLEQTRVVSPFDGHVGTRHLDLGARATSNTPVFTVVDLSTIRIKFSIPARDAVHIRPSQPAAITVDAIPGREFTGTVSRISSVFDPRTNTVEAEVEVNNPDGALKPGMFGSVRIAYRTNPTALLVPTAAIQRSAQEQWLFIAEDSGEKGLVARRVSLRVLESAGTATSQVAVEPVEGTLKAGANVIVLGQEKLSDGAPVVNAASVTAKKEGK